MRRSVILLAALTLCGYAPLLVSPSARFVFDDRRFILGNEAVHDISGWISYFTDPTTVDPRAWTGIYRPLRTLDFAVDWAIAGPSPRWFHLRNALYHLLGAILVMVLLRRWGAGQVAATLGAAVFALHPVQVEAAGWITSRGDLLCLVFFTGALILHHDARGFDRRFAGAAALLALALLSKEAAVMFPAAALLADLFFRDGNRLRTTLTRWPQYVTYAALAALYLFLWIWVHHVRAAPVWHVAIRWGDSFAGTLLTMSRGFVYYFRLLLLPVDMATDYYLKPVKTPDLLTLACAAGILAVIGVSIRRALRGGGAAAFAVLWFFVTMFPTSNIPAPIGITTAERFLSLPMVGFALAAGLALSRAFSSGRPGRIAVWALLGCLGLVTFQRATAWSSDRTIWTATLARFDSPRALEWRAETLRERGADLKRDAGLATERGQSEEADRLAGQARETLEEAVRQYDRAMAAWESLPATGPAVAVIRANRAYAWYELGRTELALQEVQEVLKTPVIQLIGRANMVKALCLHAQGNLRGAANAAEEALHWETGPGFRRKAAAIFQDLARWYNEPGRLNRARTFTALRRSWELYPQPENTGVFEALSAIEAEYGSELVPLRRAVAERTADGEIYLRLAVLYSAHADWNAARPIFDWLLTPAQAGRDPRVLFPYAMYFWEMRDSLEGYDEAAALYEEIRAVDPEWRDPDGEPAEAAIERVRKEREELLEAIR